MTDHKKARQYSDQMYCAHCGKSWDVNDPEPPECDHRTRQERAAENCDKLRKLIRSK